MNLKYYIRGVGVGMVVATLILMVAYHVRPASGLPPADTQSTRDIMANLRGTEDDTSSAAESQPPQESSSDEESQENPSGRESQDNSEGTEAPVEPEPKPPVETEGEHNTEAESQGSVITVEFVQIGTSEEAAQKLEAAGLVNNWREFNAYLMSNGYASRIHNGTYTIEVGSSYETIAEIITRR